MDGVVIITRRSVTKTVADRWREQYGHGYWASDKAKQAIQAKLDALDLTTCGHVEVDEAIGNGSWTELECDLCGAKDCERVIRLGEEPDYEARWQDLCISCAIKLGDWAKSIPTPPEA